MCDTLGFVDRLCPVFAKNSDRSPNEPQLIEYHPRRGAGGQLRLSDLNIEDSGAFAVIISRPSWMWGAEMGVNEHGLCIGNEAVFTRGAYGKGGLTGMELLRLALERCDSAKSAAELIAQLLERYGQGGNCGFDHQFYYDNAFLIMDRTELYILETARKSWVLKKLPRASISNRLSIGRDYELCDSKTKPCTDFKKTHLEPIYSFFSASKQRRTQTAEALETAESAADMMKALRRHEKNVGNPLCRGSVGSVCMHAGGIVGDHSTSSMIVELGDTPILWLTGSSTPCISLFKPFAFGNEPVPPIFPADDPAAAEYWLSREHFHRSLIGKSLPEEYYIQRNELECRWFLASRGLDAQAMQLLSRQAADEEVSFYSHWGSCSLPGDKSPAAFGRYWTKKNLSLGKPRDEL